MSSSRRGLFRLAAKSAARAIPDVGPQDVDAVPVAGLSDEELERYSRQLLLDGFGEGEQLALRDASVLIVGAGALGSPVAAYLAGAGVGRIGVADDDIVELSNLHRQPLYVSGDLDEAKAHAAVGRLQQINPEVMVEPYQVALAEHNAEGLILGHDLVVDCTDSFAARYVVNDACCQAGIDLVEGGVVGFAGLVMSVRPGASPCYRCAFPTAPPDAPTCAEAGVLGPAAGVVGSLQALEAIKLLAGLPGALLDGFLSIDLATQAFTRVAVARRTDCKACG